jgi:hypothetical protein
MNPFELALGIEMKEPMDLTILRRNGICRKGNKEVEEMAKDHEKGKLHAIKLLEKVYVSYKKKANKSRRHIKFKVGDLVWLNIKDFRMFETLVNRFIPKYASPYKVICKPHLDVYFLCQCHW